MKRAKKQAKVASKREKPDRKQTSGLQDSSSDFTFPKVRFEATIHAAHNAGPNWMDQLDIDRVPDPKGLVRALVTPADCVRLLGQGFEIHLQQAYPVGPLDPKLIETDESFRRWLDKELQKIKRPPKRAGSKDN